MILPLSSLLQLAYSVTGSLLQYAILSRKGAGHRKDSAQALQSLHSTLRDSERSRPEGKKKMIAYDAKTLMLTAKTGSCRARPYHKAPKWTPSSD